MKIHTMARSNAASTFAPICVLRACIAVSLFCVSDDSRAGSRSWLGGSFVALLSMGRHATIGSSRVEAARMPTRCGAAEDESSAAAVKRLGSTNVGGIMRRKRTILVGPYCTV